MRDADKVKVIEHVCVDALEFGEGESPDFFRGVIQAVASICDYLPRRKPWARLWRRSAICTMPWKC